MGKGAVKQEADESGNIEVHLLQRKFDQDLAKKVDRNSRSSRNLGKLRETFMNSIQSKRFMWMMIKDLWLIV